MKVIVSKDHQGHTGAKEMRYDQMIPMSESPDRVDIILGALNESGFFALQKPVVFGLDEVLRVHDPDFVKFL